MRIAVATLLLLAVFPPVGQAQTTAFALGSRVEGRIGSQWAPCITIAFQRATGGYLLRCDSLPNPENVFAESDIRAMGTAPSVRSERTPPAAPEERRVRGRVRGNWESCVQIGDRRPTGGYLLRCDSAPTVESVFSASDVRP